MSLENGQSKFEKCTPIGEDELENAKIKTKSLKWLINKAKQVTHLSARTPELLYEFIKKLWHPRPNTKTVSVIGS